jgi:hypothetical protein
MEQRGRPLGFVRNATMKLLPAPSVSGNPEAERMNRALCTMLSVSKAGGKDHLTTARSRRWPRRVLSSLGLMAAMVAALASMSRTSLTGR